MFEWGKFIVFISIWTFLYRFIRDAEKIYTKVVFVGTLQLVLDYNFTMLSEDAAEYVMVLTRNGLVTPLTLLHSIAPES